MSTALTLSAARQFLRLWTFIFISFKSKDNLCNCFCFSICYQTSIFLLKIKKNIRKNLWNVKILVPTHSHKFPAIEKLMSCEYIFGLWNCVTNKLKLPSAKSTDPKAVDPFWRLKSFQKPYRLSSNQGKELWTGLVVCIVWLLPQSSSPCSLRRGVVNLIKAVACLAFLPRTWQTAPKTIETVRSVVEHGTKREVCSNVNSCVIDQVISSFNSCLVHALRRRPVCRHPIEEG